MKQLGGVPQPVPSLVAEAARAILSGRLVVFPTETVYGLGADALDPAAVRAIFAAKGRPADNPLIVHVASPQEAQAVVSRIPAPAHTLFARFAPGPLTLVLPADEGVPREVTAGLATVAVRIPRHPIARALLSACGRPVAAPSANRSGEPSPTSVAMARSSLGDAVDVYLDGGACEVGLESTVAAVDDDRVTILRPGAVTAAEIAAAVPGIRVEHAGPAVGAGPAPSPGVRHRHYRPRATVIVCEPGDETLVAAALAARSGERSRAVDTAVAVIGVGSAVGVARDTIARALGAVPAERRADDVSAYARNLYRWFFELDEEGVDCIVAIMPPAHGIGHAVRDRLSRAGERIG